MTQMLTTYQFVPNQGSQHSADFVQQSIKYLMPLTEEGTLRFFKLIGDKIGLDLVRKIKATSWPPGSA